MSDTVTPARGGDKHERKPDGGQRDGKLGDSKSLESKSLESKSTEQDQSGSDVNSKKSQTGAVAAVVDPQPAEAAQPRLPTATAGAMLDGMDERIRAPESERNAVFSELVTGDQDVVGLVAYSIYKQNKHDFLVAFAQSKGREPTPVEIAAYIVGESTPRRLSIYRHLAEATIEGRGPDAPMTGAGGKAGSRKKSSAQGLQSILLWAILAGVLVMLVYLFTRFGLTAG